jgi:hypothetical protein
MVTPIRSRGRAVVWSIATWALVAPGARGLDFAHDVVPLLKKHCGECHTGEARQGGFSMNTRDDVLAGGDSGVQGFVEGRSDESEIIARITSPDPEIRMPSDAEPLPPEVVDVLRRWVDEKAPWEAGFAFERSTWEPPLALRRVDLPAAEGGRVHPVDRVIDAMWREQGVARPPRCDDRTFIRRASLDLVGLLPAPERVEAFVADSRVEKRAVLVRELLDDRIAWAEHWMTFWNDLLRNDYTGTGFITGGRRQITAWLHQALVDNMPFDRFVRELIAPAKESRGFIDGIVWRGTVNASQTVPIQFAQNVGQTFLGINLKCASCHDSFVDRWKLRETYDLAAIMAEQPLELHRCEKATGTIATPGWMFTELGQVDAAAPPRQRLEQLAALMTNPGNGWLSRNLVNRLWHRLMGRGLVHPVDSLRTRPWSEDLLEILACDLVDSGWNVKHVLETICTSEAYGAATPAVSALPLGRDYVFRGPLPRRMTAEQFTDAVWQITGAAPIAAEANVDRFVRLPGDPPVPPPAARWIWSNPRGGTDEGAKLAFRTTFQCPDEAVGILIGLADNSAAVFLNGEKLTTIKHWQTPVMTVPRKLRAGGNELLAVVTDAGGIAGLRLELLVRAGDAPLRAVATDASWQWTATLPDDKGRYPDATPPVEWQPAAPVVDTTAWASSDDAFAARVAASSSPRPLPMVRATLVKCTPLMAALGRPNRDQVVTSRPADLTTLEAIQLANEQALADEFQAGGRRVLADSGPNADMICRWIFAASLARSPTAAEQAATLEMLGETPTPETVADCLWAVAMLPEFQLIR